MNRMFGWMLLAFGATTLFAIAGCSDQTPYTDLVSAGRQPLSPEKASGECSPCMEPVCGDRSGYSAGTWCSSLRGVEYVFDCEECKTRFDDDPDLHLQP